MKTVRDLLVSKKMGVIKSVSPEDSVFQAVEVMGEGNFGAIPVMEGDKLVGILSERDYARKVVLKGKSSKEIKVKEIMTPDPICVSPEHTLEDCMEMMTQKGFRHLPVLDGRSVAGVISIKDTVGAVVSGKEALIKDMVEYGTHRSADSAFRQVAELIKSDFAPLVKQLEGLQGRCEGPLKEEVVEVTRTVKRLSQTLEPVTRLFQSRKNLENKRVLLATTDTEQEVMARMALGGTGVTLETVRDLKSGLAKLGETTFDMVCVDEAMVDLAKTVYEQNREAKTVFMTHEDADQYIPVLREYPFLSNIVSHREGDHSFAIKSILATVSKMLNEDYFGMEKYISWGVDVHEVKVENSNQRPAILEEVDGWLKSLGMRRTLVNRCKNVAEELLMNAIFDAPVDAEGKEKYNHLDRGTPVQLSKNEAATFRYACDGMFLGISVSDPFGRLSRELVLDYFERCFKGDGAEDIEGKGGGGHGLFIIMRSANLVVCNVKEGLATEMIALFDLQPKETSGARTSSLHFFNA